MAVNKKTGSILLIAGTSIGAGMLALPIATASAGFFDSLMLLGICWLAMWLTGLYVLEANLIAPEGANFIGMSGVTLGKLGQVITWVVYLLLLYSLMAAYLSGGGALLTAGLHDELHLTVANMWGPISWVIIVGAIIFLGAKRVDGFNRLLMIGLIVAYFILVIVTLPHIKLANLATGQEAVKLFVALPIAITSFGYHVVVPSVRSYLKSDAKKIAKVILWGSLIPLIIYAIWDLLVFGTIPIHGASGLDVILRSGQPTTHLIDSLSILLKSNWITEAASAFIFFAIATSFLGISFSLADFIADGFNIKKTAGGWVWILVLTFVPPLIFVWGYPRGFILALGYAGIFVAILHGILPALMVWASRFRKLTRDYRAPGGLIGMLAILIFSLMVIASQVTIQL